MNRRIAMDNARVAGCALVLFGSLVFSASSVSGQPCAPVVYAFRHAEDTNPPGAHPPFGTVPIFALTPTGLAHAALYPAMINDFQAATHFCPVTRVYAATKRKKEDPCDPCDSATNAFDTARPLARAVMSSDPITIVGGHHLYEFLGNGNDDPAKPDPKHPSDPPKGSDYFTPTANAVRAELLATASRFESSAIFWTSQGLHVLGGVLINAVGKVPTVDSRIPVKDSGAIPRNAVYIFVYQAPDNPSDIPGFSDTPTESRSDRPDLASSAIVQCFNHIEATNQVNSKDPNLNTTNPRFIEPKGSTQRYYCGFDNQSNLGGTPQKSCNEGARCGSSICNDPAPNTSLDLACQNKSNKDVKGKICHTVVSMLPDTSGPGIFGACE